MRDRKDTQKTRGRDDDTSDGGIPLIYVVSRQTSGMRKTAEGVRKKESPPADRGDSRDRERAPEAVVPSGQALPPQEPQEPQEPLEKPEKAAKQERPEKPGKKGWAGRARKAEPPGTED